MIPENAGSKPAFFITKDFVLNINKIIAMKEMEPEKGVVFKETDINHKISFFQKNVKTLA